LTSPRYPYSERLKCQENIFSFRQSQAVGGVQPQASHRTKSASLPTRVYQVRHDIPLFFQASLWNKVLRHGQG
jgi:hypothetical protein